MRYVCAWLNVIEWQSSGAIKLKCMVIKVWNWICDLILRSSFLPFTDFSIYVIPRTQLIMQIIQHSGWIHKKGEVFRQHSLCFRTSEWKKKTTFAMKMFRNSCFAIWQPKPMPTKKKEHVQKYSHANANLSQMRSTYVVWFSNSTLLREAREWEWNKNCCSVCFRIHRYMCRSRVVGMICCFFFSILFFPVCRSALRSLYVIVAGRSRSSFCFRSFFFALLCVLLVRPCAFFIVYSYIYIYIYAWCCLLSIHVFIYPLLFTPFSVRPLHLPACAQPHNLDVDWIFMGFSSILNGSCVALFWAIGGGPHETCRWRKRLCNVDVDGIGILDMSLAKWDDFVFSSTWTDIYIYVHVSRESPTSYTNTKKNREEWWNENWNATRISKWLYCMYVMVDYTVQ